MALMLFTATTGSDTSIVEKCESLRGSSRLWHDHLFKPVRVWETTLGWFVCPLVHGAAIFSGILPIQRRSIQSYVMFSRQLVWNGVLYFKKVPKEVALKRHDIHSAVPAKWRFPF